MVKYAENSLTICGGDRIVAYIKRKCTGLGNKLQIFLFLFVFGFGFSFSGQFF